MTAPRVLLTGATGFVGRHLAADLAASGWVVRAALRDTSSRLPGVAETVPADLAGTPDWAAALAGVDTVIHAAGIAHAGPGLPDALYDRVNRHATLDLAQAAAGRVRRFVFLSSIRAQSGPSSPTVLTEDDPARPTDAYGRSKLAAEQGLEGLDLDWVALRPVVVYGPGVKGNVAQLLRLARLPVPLPLGDLRAPRSLLSIDNLATAIRHVLAMGSPARGALIVADPVPTSVAAMLAALRAGLGRPPGLVRVPAGLLSAVASLAGKGDLFERLAGPMAADPGRLIRLGWQPPIRSTPEGLERWLRSPPVRG